MLSFRWKAEVHKKEELWNTVRISSGHLSKAGNQITYLQLV